MKETPVVLLLISISFFLINGTVQAKNANVDDDNAHKLSAEIDIEIKKIAGLKSYSEQGSLSTLKIECRIKLNRLYEKLLDNLTRKILLMAEKDDSRYKSKIESLESQLEKFRQEKSENEKELRTLQGAATNMVRPFKCKKDGLTKELCAGDVIKVKVSRKLTSGNLREGDNVEFVVANDVVKWVGEVGKKEPLVLIQKGASAFGKVTKRKGRFFLWLNGGAKLTIQLDEVMTVDGLPISSSFLDSEECSCIKGRITVGNVSTSVFAGLAVAALVLVKDPTAKVVAGLTLLKEISSIQSINELANGSDAQIDEGMIYEAVINQDQEIEYKRPFQNSDGQRGAQVGAGKINPGSQPDN